MFKVLNSHFEVVGRFDTYVDALAYAKEWESKTGRRFGIMEGMKWIRQ